MQGHLDPAVLRGRARAFGIRPGGGVLRSAALIIVLSLDIRLLGNDKLYCDPYVHSIWQAQGTDIVVTGTSSSPIRTVS